VLAIPVQVSVLCWPLPVAVGASLLVSTETPPSLWPPEPVRTTPPWDVIVPFTLTAVAGSLFGK
jgi:hypothetical protein